MEQKIKNEELRKKRIENLNKTADVMLKIVFGWSLIVFLILFVIEYNFYNFYNKFDDKKEYINGNIELNNCNLYNKSIHKVNLYFNYPYDKNNINLHNLVNLDNSDNFPCEIKEVNLNFTLQ